MAVPLIYDYRGIPVYERDEDFLFKALSYKQEKLDTNRGKLQGLYDQYSMLSAMKGVDKEYINGRLKEVTDIVDQYTSGDLSSDYLTQNLMSNLDQMVDQKVINAVSSKKLREKEIQEWEEARLEGGEKYAKLNEEWALNKNPNWQGYINNQEVGAVYNGGSEFIEFVDVHKQISASAMKIAKRLEASYVQVTQDAFGNFIDITGKKVSREKLRAAIDAELGPKEKKQLEINGWGQYNQLDDQQLEEQFNSFNALKVDTMQQELAKTENFMKTSEYQSATEQEKAEVQEATQHYRTEIEKITSGQLYQQATSNGRDFVETYLYTNRLMNDVLNGYEFNEVTSIDVNKSFKYYNDNKRADEKIAREALEKSQKAQAEKVEKEGTGPTTPTMGSVDQVDGYEKNTATALQQKQKYAASARKEFDALLKEGEYTGEQQKQIRDFVMRSTTGEVTQSTNIKYLNSDGVEETIILGTNEIVAMLKYKQVLAGETAADGLIKKSIAESDGAIAKIMQDAYNPKNINSNNDYKDNLPLVQGEYSEHVTDPKSSKGRVARLAVLVADPGLSREERREYFNEYKRLVKQEGSGNVSLDLPMRPEMGAGKHTFQRRVVEINEDFIRDFDRYRVRGLSDIDTRQWQVRDKGTSSDRYVSEKTPAQVIKNIKYNLNSSVEKAIEQNNILPAPRPMTFGGKSKEAEILRQRVVADMPEGDTGLDDKQPVTVVPVYDAKKTKSVTGYVIEYFDKDKVKIKSAEIPTADMKEILPLATTTAPLINANVPGQSFTLGSPKGYVEKGRSGVVKSPEAIENIDAAQTYAQALKNNSTTQADKDKIDAVFSDFYEGRLKFEIATTKGAGIVVNIRSGNSILHTAHGIIEGGQIQATELADVTRLTRIQNLAFYEYLTVVADGLETTRKLRDSEDTRRGTLK